jgi:EAL domain-containing protein (putative c-di-GMP-specific phosphodiesterase class I)
LVDDDVSILRLYGKALKQHGWTVEPVSDARDAVDRMGVVEFDAVLSDVSMPNMTGLEFLRAVRTKDLDVPVILMSGTPNLESAIEAIEYGALRYLIKPVDLEVLEATIRHAVQLHAMARLNRLALDVIRDECGPLGDLDGLAERFTDARDFLWIAYQPIVSIRDQSIFGYEAFVRSNEPSFPNPQALFKAAEQLGRVPELGRVIRRKISDEAGLAPDGVKIFVNLHPLDLGDRDLYAPGSPLAAIASRVVLEITQRASADRVRNVTARMDDLRLLGFSIAVDDLGSGYAGLSSYAELEPEIAKIDMSLIRGIDASPRKQSVVRSMKRLCDELGTLVIAEGVQTPAERDTLVELGCGLLQGYLFGKPERNYPVPQW